MLREVVEAGKQVLEADRGTVWLYDAAADELLLEVATDIDPIRVPAGKGLVGSCARNRSVINVRDCYTDARFDPSMDKRTGYKTRCMLTLPLIDHKDVLVGVMQLLNKREVETVLTVMRRSSAVVDRSLRARLLTALSMLGPPLLQPTIVAPLLPQAITVAASVVGLAIVIAGKLTLGRSFGLMSWTCPVLRSYRVTLPP